MRQTCWSLASLVTVQMKDGFFVVRLCMSAKPLSSPVAYSEALVHPLNGLTAAVLERGNKAIHQTLKLMCRTGRM